MANIGQGNGLVPEGTKPLPEPILTYQQCTYLWHSSDNDLIRHTEDIDP